MTKLPKTELKDVLAGRDYQLVTTYWLESFERHAWRVVGAVRTLKEADKRLRERRKANPKEKHRICKVQIYSIYTFKNMRTKP